MTYEEIKSLSDDQLKDQLMTLRKEQMNLRFQKAGGQMETPNRTREVRKDIARLKTEQSARANSAAAQSRR